MMEQMACLQNSRKAYKSRNTRPFKKVDVTDELMLLEP